MRPTTRVCLLSLGLLLLGACATLPPGKRDPRDPFERFNRASFAFNDVFDRGIAKPVAHGYTHLPHVVRVGVRNFLDNLNYPIVMANDLLQGEGKAFLNDTGRLVLNTTFGIGGLFDPATGAGLDKNNRDLGQTLGKWGVSSGPYLVVPLLGPYTVRDGFGAIADDFITPRHYIENRYWGWGLWLLDRIDERSLLLSASEAMEKAYDPYGFERTAYLQYRDFLVTGGQSKEEEERQRKLFEEAEQYEPVPPAPPPPEKTPETPPPETPPPK